MLRALLWLCLLSVVALLGVCLLHTFSLHAQPPAPPPASALSFDEPEAVQHLASVVRIPTISPGEGLIDDSAFAQLQTELRSDFPQVFANLQVETVGHGALLLRWPGRDSRLQPIVLMGHMDVVPVADSALPRWTHAPFSGDVADGYVWGRGTLDDKSTVLALLEACEALLRQGYQPQRDILLAFGDDEEVGGHDGAQQIVSLLQQRQVHAEFVLDEGGSITHSIVPGARGDVALIGIAEKGYLTLRLSVRGTGGHSSMPPPHSVIGTLSAAITRLEASPMPSRLTRVSTEMFDAMAPEQPFAQRLVMSNHWLFAPLLKQIFGQTPSGAATLRTTTAVTEFHSGIKDNVLPDAATALVNFRILPGDSVQDVIAHTHAAIADERVKIDIEGTPSEPSAVSATDSRAFGLLDTTLHQLYPDTSVAPYLVLGATDSAKYAPISTDIYRFSPVVMNSEDLDRIHGDNERILAADYLREIRFMGQLIVSATATP